MWRRGLACTVALPGSRAPRVACSCLQITKASLALTPDSHALSMTLGACTYIMLNILFLTWSQAAVVMVACGRGTCSFNSNSDDAY